MLTHLPANLVFSKIRFNRHREAHPPWPNSWAVNVKSRDNVKISGWAHRPPGNQSGTLFLLHGFTSHCMKNNYLEFAEHFAARHKLVVCSFDFRHHGRSENAPPTFGEAESWDLAAFLDEADRHGSPKPYILIGESLGAMAAQRLAISDSRISGAVLLHPPAWPWDAVGKALNSWPVVAGAGTLINLAYGRNILAAGDVRQYPAHPEHQPRLLYVMGDQDHYDWKQTRKIYDHWYSGSPATFNEWPAAKPAERKWFVLIPGAQHPDNNPDKFTLLTWPPLIPLLDEFLEIVLH